MLQNACTCYKIFDSPERRSGKNNQGMIKKFQAGAEGSIEKIFRRSIEIFLCEADPVFLRTDTSACEPEVFITRTILDLSSQGAIVAQECFPAGSGHW
jgi:hypothetical protein